MNTRNWSSSIILFLLSISTILAQSPTLEWAYQIGNQSIDATLAQTTDAAGNIYSVGYFTGSVDLNPGPGFLNVSSQGSTDMFIQKMDASGNFIWGKKIGGQWADNANDLAVDNSGNVYVTGGFRNTVDFDPGSGVFNRVADNTFQNVAAFILKLNSSGTFHWVRTADTESEGYAVDTDNSGNVYVAGRILNWVDFGTTSVGGDAFFWKLNSNGDQQWVKALDDVGGSIGLRIANHGLQVDEAGNMFVTGRFNGTQDFIPGNGAQNLVSNGGSDAFLAKYNSSCILQWVKQIGGSGSDYGLSLHRSSTGDLYVSGAFSGISDFDPESGTGQYAFQSNGSLDVYALKTNSNGDVQWAAAFGGPGFDYAGDITANSAGEVVVTGYYEETADFDPDLINTFNLTAVGGDDVFIEKLSANGELQWVHSIGSTGDDNGWTVHYHGNNLYAGGDFSGTADFDPSSTSFDMTSAASTAAYIMKLGECTPTTSTINAVSCGAYTSPSGNNTWNSTGTYTDVVSNTSGCDSIITINLTIDDAVSPVPDANSLSTITAQCEVTSLAAPTATDNCAGSITGTQNTSFPITSSTTVTWIYDDGNGNTSTQTQEVVINDNTAPVANAGSLTDVIGECEVTSLSVPTATDNCSGTVTGTHNATFPITGSATITWTYDDGNGNTSTQSQNVVISDVTAPVADVQSLSDVISQCEITSLTAPTATDNCEGSITGTHNASLPVSSSTTVTWTYDDGNGNTSTQTQELIINDVTAPIGDLASLNDVTDECEVVLLSSPTATDNCEGSITGTHNTSFPITSSTTVTWTYDDGNGNTSTQTQEVVITPVDNSVTMVNGVTLTADASGYSYQWVDCDNANSPISGETDQTFVAATNGNYAVVIDNGSCTVISDCIQILTVGIQNPEEKLIRVYPNPTSGQVFIELPELAEQVSLEFLDLNGRLVLQQSFGAVSTVNTSVSLQSGIYFLRLEVDGTITKIAKIMKL